MNFNENVDMAFVDLVLESSLWSKAKIDVVRNDLMEHAMNMLEVFDVAFDSLNEDEEEEDEETEEEAEAEMFPQIKKSSKRKALKK